MTTSQPSGTHKTADGYPVTEGEAYWDSGLHLVTVTRVASHADTNRNPDSGLFGQTVYWHDTTGGMADGSRLAKRHPFTRELAEPASDVIGTDEAVTAARKLGENAGTAAASRVFDGSTTDETYATVLAGLDAGDPAVYDMFREPSFSGEYAGDYSERDLCDDLDVDYDLSETSEVDELADAYLDAARESFWQEVERLAREHVPSVESYRCPCCGDDVMDTRPVCSDCRDAGCEASADTCGESGYWSCQRESDEGTDQS